MALVHDKLYQTTSLSDIEMDTYIQELVESLKSTFTCPDSEVTVEYDIDDIHMNIDQAIPCGLLINELVVNAFKHAFEENNGNGVLAVKLKRDGKHLQMVVSDNGQGLPEDVREHSGSSLGMLLIDTFTNQLGAEKEIWNDNGAHFSFRFSPGIDGPEDRRNGF